MKLNLQKKLYLAFALSILVPILLICILLGVQIMKSDIKGYYANASKALGHIDKSIEILLSDAMKTAATISDSDLLKQANDTLTSYKDQTEDITAEAIGLSDQEKQIVAFLRSFSKNNPAYVEIYFGTRWGGFVTSGTSKMPAGYDPRKRPWYTAALATPETPSLSSAYLFSNGNTGISMMKPFKDNSGQVLGVAGVDMGLSGLTDFIKTVKMGESGFVMMVQDDGTILANPKDEKTNFKKMTETGVPAFSTLAGMREGNVEVALSGVAYLAAVHTMPGFNWKLVGLVEKSEIMAGVYRTLWTMVGIGAAVFIVFMGIAFFIARSISKPLASATFMLKDIAQGEGDLTQKLEVTTSDELGEMAHWFNTFIQKLKEIIQEVVQTAGKVNQASDSLSTISGTMKERSDQTAQKASKVAGAAQEVDTSFTSVAAAMEETTQNTNMVATAAEEMSATISEIAKNAENAREITGRAVLDAQAANAAMSGLDAAATAIGTVTNTIAEISEQTNLLALNATIEAARAGEAGKGFAVVAGEIKDLASQTAHATGDIRKQVEDIQSSSTATIGQIDGISSVISEINDIIATIATAIEEQSAATREIADNVSQASIGLQDVNENVAQSSVVVSDISQDIVEVNAAATDLNRSSESVASSSRELHDLAQALHELLGKFKTQ